MKPHEQEDKQISNRPALAGLLAPLRVQLDRTQHGYELTLEPMHVADVLAVLTRRQSFNASNIVLSRTATDEGSKGDLQRLSECLDRDQVVEVSETDDWADVLDPPPSDLEVVSVDGEVEPADAVAVTRARLAGVSALAAEIRATMAVRVTEDRLVVAEMRELDDAMAFIAERLRLYVAGARGTTPNEVSPPDVRLIENLLDRSGSFQIRPIETEVYSSAVDIGILTASTAQPADTSLIYDIYANTWHGD